MLRFMLAMNAVTVKEKTAREAKIHGGKIRGGKMCGGKMCGGKMCGEKMCEGKMREGKRKWNCVSIYGMIAIGMSCAARVPYVIRQLADKIA